MWNDATSTPLQRPDTSREKDVLSEDEADEFQEELAFGLSRDRRDGGNAADVNRAYNEHWMDARRLKITADRRTSLIVDPPDGRIPPLVPLPPAAAGQSRRAPRSSAIRGRLAGRLHGLSLPIRCIIRTDCAAVPADDLQQQLSDLSEPWLRGHRARDDSQRAHHPGGWPPASRTLRQWLGDTRGHWEGTTLVVETTNFRTDEGAMYQGANPATFAITERFSRVAPDTINYEFTVSDPATWTKPWTAVIPWTKVDPGEQMYEYACHEDNFDIVHLLTGARLREKNGETVASEPARAAEAR